MVAIQWIGEHANKVAAAVRAFMYMAVALSWTVLTDMQIGTVLLFTEAILALFVESNTVSKVRVGERITEGVAKEMASGTGSGLAILCAVMLGASTLVGCASAPKPKAVTSYQAVEIGLGAVQDAEMALYKSKTFPALTAEKHQAISRQFVQAFDMQIKFGHALQVWQPGAAPPATYNDWVSSVENVLTALGEVAPADDSLLATTISWAKNVVDVIKTLGQIVPQPIAVVVP